MLLLCFVCVRVLLLFSFLTSRQVPLLQLRSYRKMKLTLTDVLVKRENPSRRIRKAKVNQYRIRVERMFFFSLKGKGFTGTLRTRKYKSGSPHILFSGLKIKKLSPSSPKHTHVHTHSPALASSFSRSLNLLFSIVFLTWISQKENILPKMFPLLVFFFLSLSPPSTLLF